MNIRNIIAENKLADFGKIEPKESSDKTPINPVDEPLPQPETTQNRDLDNDDFDSDNSPKVSQRRLRKGKIFLILLFLASIAAGTYFLLPMLDKKDTPIADIPEKLPAAPNFIDDGGLENKALKENVEAKKKHVNIFEFDINNCLQTYSDEQCVDMYDKSLQVNE